MSLLAPALKIILFISTRLKGIPKSTNPSPWKDCLSLCLLSKKASENYL